MPALPEASAFTTSAADACLPLALQGLWAPKRRLARLIAVPARMHAVHLDDPILSLLGSRRVVNARLFDGNIHMLAKGYYQGRVSVTHWTIESYAGCAQT